jgi:hypothetical protein
LRVAMLESESLIIGGKLEGLTVLRALSVRLIKDKIRRAGKARRIESLSFSKIDMKTL